MIADVQKELRFLTYCTTTMDYNDHINYQKWWETRYKELIQSAPSEEKGKQIHFYLILFSFIIILTFILFIVIVTPSRSKQVQESSKKRKIVVPPLPPSRKSTRLSTLHPSSKGKGKVKIEVEEMKDEESGNLTFDSSKLSSLSLFMYIISCKPHFFMEQQLILLRLKHLKIHSLL